MKKIVVVLAVAVATLAFYAAPALADQPPDLQCPSGGTTYDSGSGSQTIDGVTITWGGTSVTVSGGSATLCVKAADGNSGIITLNDGESYDTSAIPNNGGQAPAISHIVVYSTTQTTTTGSETTGSETTGNETTGNETTGNETTGNETTGNETTGNETTGNETTGTGGVSGGTTGGTTGGTAATPSGGNLPFTGLPVWVPLLAAAAMLASGILLVRRRKDEVA